MEKSPCPTWWARGFSFALWKAKNSLFQSEKIQMTCGYIYASMVGRMNNLRASASPQRVLRIETMVEMPDTAKEFLWGGGRLPKVVFTKCAEA